MAARLLPERTKREKRVSIRRQSHYEIFFRSGLFFLKIQLDGAKDRNESKLEQKTIDR
jgi:hypothetical protein